MKCLIAAIAAATVMTSAAMASAQPVGTFRAEGRNPGAAANSPPSYRGTVTITQAGEGYSVVWIVGEARSRVEGRGLFQNGVFSVAFPNAQPAGPALIVYTRRGNVWVGRWIIPGSTAAGSEVLTR